MCLAGNCIPHNDSIANTLVMCTHQRGKRKLGRQPFTYKDNIMKDFCLDDVVEIRSVIMVHDRLRIIAIIAIIT